jgi:hypothetical protein
MYQERRQGMKRHGNLWPQVISFENLLRAAEPRTRHRNRVMLLEIGRWPGPFGSPLQPPVPFAATRPGFGDQLEEEPVQPLLAQIPDVHAGPSANLLRRPQDLNVLGPVRDGLILPLVRHHRLRGPDSARREPEGCPTTGRMVKYHHGSILPFSSKLKADASGERKGEDRGVRR